MHAHARLLPLPIALLLACGTPAPAGPVRPDASSTPDAVAPDVGNDLPPDVAPDVAPDIAAPDVATEDAPLVDASSPADVSGGATRFVRHVVDTAASGPSFVTVADVNLDGRLDLVVSKFGPFGLSVAPGEVTAYIRGDSLDRWTPLPILRGDNAVKFPNRVTVSDLDGDRDLDVVVPYGFLVCAANPLNGGPCGGLAWYEADGGTWRRRDIVAPGSALFYHHAELVDLDLDGVTDLVTVGEEKPLVGAARAVTQWFHGTRTAERFERTPRVVGAGGGSFPSVLDLDGDGDLDIASAEYFQPGGSFAWFEQVAAPSPTVPAGTWTRHALHADSGPSIMLAFVPGLYGDARRIAVGANHTNTAAAMPDRWESAVFAFEPGADLRAPWTRTQLSTGIRSAAGLPFAPQAAPGIFGVGDVDGDGDLDIALSGDGDPHVYWLEQTAPSRFTTRVLEERLPQAGGMVVRDLDGNGTQEIAVTGYENNVVYVYERAP